VTAVFTLFDSEAAGSAVFTQTEASLPVVGGSLVVELGRTGNLDDSLVDVPVYLEVAVGGAVLSPRATIEAHPLALHAKLADIARLAADVDRLGSLLPENVVGKASLAAAGQAAVHFGNLQGFPAAFADGDQGLVFTPSSQFTLSGSTLGIAAGQVTSGVIKDGAVGSAEIADGAVTSTKIANSAVHASNVVANAVATGDIKNASLTSRVLGDTNATNRITIYEVTNATCAEGVGSLVTASSCAPVDTCAGSFVRDCRNSCVTGSAGSCTNRQVGFLPFAP
jgi:hypothetical protein